MVNLRIGTTWIKATTTASRYASYPNIQKLATHVLDEVDNLADDLLSTLEADLAGNNALKTAFEEDVSLLDTWKNVQYSTNSRKLTKFLQALKEIKANILLKDHINFGNIKVIVKDSRTGAVIREESFLPGGGTQIQNGQSATVNVSGFHNINNLGANVREVAGSKVIAGTLPDGTVIYKANIEFRVKELDQFNPNGTLKKEGWKGKTEPSTYFPSNWDDNKVAEVVADAYSNAVFSGRKWVGTTSDGVIIEGYIDNLTNKNITSAYIKF